MIRLTPTVIQVTIGEVIPIEITVRQTLGGDMLLEKYKTLQEVTPDPDGVETVFATGTPYIAGTLQLFRDQSVLLRDEDYLETDPDEGTFTLLSVPESDELIRATYISQ